MWIYLYLKFFGGAAPAVDGGDPGNCQESAGNNPVLDRAQIRDSEVLRANDLITIDFSCGTVRLDGWNLTSRKSHVLLHRDRCLAVGEVVVHAVFEGDTHKRQPVERSGSDDVDAWGRVQANLHGKRVVTLHLLRGEAWSLCGDFQNHRRRVWVRFDVELFESNKPGAYKQQQTQKHNRSAAEAKSDQRLEHGLSSFME